MREKALWVVLGAVILVVGATAFAVGRMMAGPQSTPQIDVSPPSPEERERQKLRIAASEGKLVEATPGPEGWIVRYEEEAKELGLQPLLENAARFYRDLDRARVPIAETSYTARSNALKDVWGNPLRDVALLHMELSGATFRRINWRGFDPKNFERVAEAFWVHEEILRMEREKKEKEQQGGGQGSEMSQGSAGDRQESMEGN